MLNINAKIAVLGLGTEGRDVVKYLLSHGYKDITVFDRKRKEDLDLNGIDSSKINFITGENYLKKELSEYSTIFRSPGVYRYLPEIVDAESKGCEITSDIKLFFEKYRGLTIGVTGTKGKGTTSTLIYEIIKQKTINTYLAGNIGSPPLSILDETDEKSVVVLELSSFQLIDLDKSPNIAVVLNIGSDHMDWHKDQKEYIDAKKNIINFQKTGEMKILNYDYETSKSFAKISPSATYFFSRKEKVKGVYVKDGVIFSDFNGKQFIIGKTEKLLLRGKHNWENVSAAVCASLLAGASTDNIRKTVFSFKGLEHRLEMVTEVDGKKYYNDSFSTNPQTTIAAVDSFTEPITLILGGYDKGLDFEEMVKHICSKKNIRNIILIGDTEDKLFRLFKKYEFKTEIVKMGKNRMIKIVGKCRELTKKGGIVLLSPSCASFDMFKDYKDRGNQFRKAVKKL